MVEDWSPLQDLEESLCSGPLLPVEIKKKWEEQIVMFIICSCVKEKEEIRDGRKEITCHLYGVDPKIPTPASPNLLGLS